MCLISSKGTYFYFRNQVGKYSKIMKSSSTSDFYRQEEYTELETHFYILMLMSTVKHSEINFLHPKMPEIKEGEIKRSKFEHVLVLFFENFPLTPSPIYNYLY
jgi:hypothetical protein